MTIEPGRVEEPASGRVAWLISPQPCELALLTLAQVGTLMTETRQAQIDSAELFQQVKKLHEKFSSMAPSP